MTKPLHCSLLLLLTLLMWTPTTFGKTSAGHSLNQVVTKALATHWIIALGENHRHLELHQQIGQLLADPKVQALVDDIVVEFGNSRYQEAVDRYISGENVAFDTVQPAFRNTISSPGTVWDSPVYADFFKQVRKLNQQRKDGKKYRVVLADSPVIWQQVKSRDDIKPFYNRSESIFKRVKSQVLKKGRRAILIAGGAHLTRQNMIRTSKHGYKRAEVSVVARLALHYPGVTFVIRSLGNGRGIEHDKFTDIKPGAVLYASNPRIKNISANAISSMRNMDGSPFSAYGSATIGTLVDAVIYWGPKKNNHFVDGPASIYQNEQYWAELNRRSLLLRGKPMDPEYRE